MLVDRVYNQLRSVVKRKTASKPGYNIAIIGVGCRFPGKVISNESYAQLLLTGKDGISSVPYARRALLLNNQEKFNDELFNPGGYLEDISLFDNRFFNISPKEATFLDPQQRLLLEVTHSVFDNAAIDPRQLKGSRTGVFMGLGSHDYVQLIDRAMPTKGAWNTIYIPTGNSASTASGRLSYFYGLEGPNMVVDTACSSSLVSVHLACQSLILGESDLALAGGVNIILNYGVSAALRKGQMLSPDGRCKSFDKTANGYVRSEGCGIVLLKRLSDAERDRDNIMAVIQGSAVNQDGASNGLTAPSPHAQERVIQDALNRAGIAPNAVSFIEAHGTGTALGDPIEVNALKAVYMEKRSSEAPLTIGAVKSQIGHLEAASGVAGLIKLIVMLQHRMTPKNLHFNELNPNIDLEGMPLCIATETKPWRVDAKQKRIAAVNSFGFSGTNAHVIIEEAPDRVRPITLNKHEQTCFILPLSAKTPVALGAQIKQYIEYIETNPEISIADICYTAGVGRSHFRYRAAITGSKRDDILHQLIINEFLVSQENQEPLDVHVTFTYLKHRGLKPSIQLGSQDVSQIGEIISHIYKAFEVTRTNWPMAMNALAHLYILGAEIDWRGLAAPYHRMKVQLPTYPFQREHHWVDIGQTTKKTELSDLFYQWGWKNRRVDSDAILKNNNNVLPSHWLLVGQHRSSLESLHVALLASEHSITVTVLCNATMDDLISTLGEMRVDNLIMLFDNQIIESMPESGLSNTLQGISFIQAIMQRTQTNSIDSAHPQLKVYWITQSAQSNSKEEPVDASQAAIWGLGRTIQNEAPEYQLTLVDIESSILFEKQVNQILIALFKADNENQILIRESVHYVGRLYSAPELYSETMDLPCEVKNNVTYLITGGLSGLGWAVCQWLVAEGARHIALLGRRTPNEAVSRQIKIWSKQDVQVVTYAVDIADWNELNHVFLDIQHELPILKGIIHCAGVLSDATLLNQEQDSIVEVFKGKAQGAWHLHELTKTLALDRFIVFSSITALAGTAGQANYAAANAFLDGLITYRISNGLPGMSINWGPWGEIGMAASIRRQFGPKSMVNLISPAQALHAFSCLWSQNAIVAHAVVVAFNKTRLLSSLIPPTLSELVESQNNPKPVMTSLISSLQGLSETEAKVKLLIFLKQEVAQVLHDNHPEQLDVNLSLTDLGIDSLMMVELQNRLRLYHFSNVNIGQMFQSIQVLTNEIYSHLSMIPPKDTSFKIPRVVLRKNEFAPLSFAQERLWILHQLLPNKSAYNIAFMIGLKGTLDNQALSKAFQYVIDRHDILRTYFISNENGNWQAILKPEAFLFRLQEDQNSNIGDEYSVLRQYLEDKVNIIFDLSHGPLFKAGLIYSKNRDKVVLWINIHHSIIDGWSLHILLSDLSHAYEAYHQNKEPCLEPLLIQYSDYSIWHRDYLRIGGVVHNNQLDYWLKNLKGVPSLLNLPIDRPRPAVQSMVGAHQSFIIDKMVSIKLIEFATQYQTTPFMVIFGAFHLLLHLYTNQSDFIVGTPVAGRQYDGIDNLIGFFVNTLAIRSNITKNDSFVTVLHKLKQTMLDAYNNQDLPFERLVEHLNPPRNLSYPPLIQVMFVFQKNKSDKFELDELVTLFHDPICTNTAKLELTMELYQTPEGINGVIEYATALFDQSTIIRFIEHWHLLLDEMTANPNAMISDFNIVKDAVSVQGNII